jgi:hypothetical protein
MANISEIAWHPTSKGKCPQCGRYRKLGLVNDGLNQFARCIDCCFGPPVEYWTVCDDCGQLFVGEHCDNPKCETRKNWRR